MLISDPWAVPTRTSNRASTRAFTVVAAAALIGAAGPVVALVRDEPRGAAGFVVVLLVGFVAAAVALRPVLVTKLVPDRQPVALAMLPLVGAEASWARSASWPWFVVLIAASVVVVAATTAWSGARAVNDRLGSGVAALGRGASTLVVALIATPLLYLPGLVVRLVRVALHPRRRWNDANTRWIRRSTTQSDDRRGAAYMFASVDRARTARTNGAALVVATALVATIVMAPWRNESRAGIASVDPKQAALNFRYSRTPFTEKDSTPYIQREAYRGNPVAAVIERDQGHIFMSANAIGGSRVDDFSTETFNVSRGERMTLQPDCNCPHLTVWFFGGSAGFGIGQRDDHTVASELVRAAENEGIGLELRNFATPAWTVWQEYQALVARLATGDGDKPDLVVFFDGFNDVVGTLFETALRGVDRHTPTLLSNADVWDVVEGHRDVADDGGGEAIGRLGAEKYLDVKRLIDRALRGTGTKSAFFLQPDSLTSVTQQRAAKLSFGGDLGIVNQLDMIRALDVAESVLRPEVTDLRQLFTRERKVVFLDSVHFTEAAARTIAGVILDDLRPTLRALATKPAR